MKDICKRCNGKGNPFCPYNSGFCPKDKKPQTNEEWFDTLSTTEEKAEAIYECVMANSWSFNKNGIKRWLKQPHKEETR